MSGVVVIGAGQAAAEFVITARGAGYAGPITLIGDERWPPYQRPPLSKKFLANRGAPESLYLRAERFWTEQSVTLRLGLPARAIDRRAKRVVLADGTEVAYETLVLATGATAHVPSIVGIGLENVFSIRRIDDVQRLRRALDQARRVSIIGGGYIGLEAAAVVRGEGRMVTVLEAQERLMKRVTSAPVSDFYRGLHERRGVEIRLGVRIEALQGNGRVEAVRLSDAAVATDLVINATGARPNTELAAAAGIACDDGIAVDEHGRTSDPYVIAVGDCTRFPSRRYGRRVRLECVQNAFDQAKCAALSFVGKSNPYDPVPWFWSDQYDVKFQSAGLAEGHDRMEVIGDPASGRFSVEYRKAGRLIAVDAVNDGRAYMAGRKQIEQETER